MSEMKIFDRTINVLSKVLDLRQQKQELIASNIANAQTPGYIPAQLSFEEDLARALQNNPPPKPDTPKAYSHYRRRTGYAARANPASSGPGTEQ